MISPSLCKQIIQSRDVNLATLLIQYYDHPDPNSHFHQYEDKLIKDDPRLKGYLKLTEFVTAFGTSHVPGLSG
jgi:hypothetical protein